MDAELEEYLNRPTNKAEGYADVPIGRAIDKQRIFRLVQTTIRKIVSGKMDAEEAEIRIKRNVDKIAATNQEVYSEKVTNYINHYVHLALAVEKE